MSTTLEPSVTLCTFGEDRRQSRIKSPAMTVAELLAEHGVAPKGRRVARNGHAVGLDTVVRPDDQISVVPRVEGG
jgi:sulfur carrier protein ThiS